MRLALRVPLGVLTLSCFLASACASTQAPTKLVPSVDDPLAAVTFVHGGAGPWVVLGYRMGRAALVKLGLPRRSFDLEVVHHTPQKVQFSCIADGAAAATGASLGKLNLKLVDASDADVVTTYVNRATGASVTFRPTTAFRTRFLDVPRAELATAGALVARLPDVALFEEVNVTAAQ